MMRERRGFSVFRWTLFFQAYLLYLIPLFFFLPSSPPLVEVTLLFSLVCCNHLILVHRDETVVGYY